MANGLDERRALAHAARVRALDARIDGIRVLAGIECDILADGSLDLADDCLAELDIVVASVHSAMRQDESEMTARVLKAIEHPWVDIIGHPTSRILLRREPARMDMDRWSLPRRRTAWHWRSTRRSIVSTFRTSTPAWRASAASSW